MPQSAATPASSSLSAPPTPSPKESAAQHVERVKRERPSWSILDDIRRYAREGFEGIPADDLAVRLRAWGLYTQGDGAGVRGDAVRYFMMRVRTPNGALTSTMCRTIADLADRYARGTLDITNRQNFQLHWLRIEDVPAIWDALAAVGWTSQGACGDNTRTVTGCPLAGVDAGEVVDASPIAIAVDRHFNGHPDFANLPRKFKISITGCRHWCSYPEINDIGLTAVRRGDEVGFSLRVGGGLSTRPHLAVRLDAFVQWDQVVAVAEAVAGIFRDSDVLRVSRGKARMKYLFLTQGWTAERFLAEVNARLGYTVDRAVAEEQLPPEHFRDHVGIHPQRQPGLSYAGFSVAAGRLRPRLLHQIADWADEYGDGTLRTTISQNLVVLNVRDDRVHGFESGAVAAGVAPVASPFQRGIVACTGSEFCKLALVETKAFSLELIPALERRLPEFRQHLRIHVTGCPNACGQHSIADIGLQGVQIEDGGRQVDGFDLFVGGGLGTAPDFAHRVGVRLPATRVADAIDTLLRAYLATREEGDVFRSWTARVGDAQLRGLLTAA
jgi:sulfite reductase (ferredoxin)